MKTDKSTVIGFILLGVLFLGFFWYTNKENSANIALEKHRTDSIAALKALQKPVTNVQDSLHQDSVSKNAAAGDFTTAGVGKEQLTQVENDLMIVTFSNKGGQVKSVALKNYKSFKNPAEDVVLGGDSSDLSYMVNTSASTVVPSSDLYFATSPITKNADGSQSITFSVAGANGESVSHQYTIKKDQYLIDWNVNLTGANKLLTQNSLNLHWNTPMYQQQKALDYEKQQSRICFWENNDFDFERAKSGNTVTKDFTKPVQWLSFKQQFFNTTVLLVKDNFKSGKASMVGYPDSAKKIFESSADMQVQVPATANVSVPMQLYFGPNDYAILKKYDNGMKNIVDLGSGMFSFVKYINRGVIYPIFNFFAGFITNFGWVIALMTLVIRLLISPLTYSSYKSGAKMRVLRPELDELKKKFGSDQQGYAVEQMKVFREAGVNPLGGCIPALLQIPIFFALYSFFSSNIELRGKSFLWAHDLSNYDSIITWGTHIPIIGDHLSLFTVLSSITSFLIAFYNMSATPTTQDNPALKYMPYITPILFLFWWNSLPSALTWYYTVSNAVTLLIQLIIQKVIINPEKLQAQIAEKRKDPKKGKGKFQARFEQMAEMQKKMQQAKEQQNKR